jgi:hypothetical protein
MLCRLLTEYVSVQYQEDCGQLIITRSRALPERVEGGWKPLMGASPSMATTITIFLSSAPQPFVGLHLTKHISGSCCQP